MLLNFPHLRTITLALSLAATAFFCLSTSSETQAVDPAISPPAVTQPNPTPNIVFYVDALKGRGRYSGTIPAPNADNSDGPFGALTEARDKIRELKSSGRLTAPVTVYLRGGSFHLNDTITFGVEDSAPVTYTSYPAESAIIDGSRRITNWQTTTVNGKSAWVADLPEVKSGRWYFRQLFVEGQRSPRATLPKKDYYQVVAPALQYQVTKTNMGPITNAFTIAPNIIDPHWKNFSDIDLVLLHFWTEERSPITSFDPATNTVVLNRIPTQPIGDGKKYPQPRFYIENVFEALTEPGEWYLDRPTGKLYYIPRPGEDMTKTEILAPRVTHLIQIKGDPANQHYVEFLHFQNLTFANGDWTQPTNKAFWMGLPDATLASGGQGASALPGNIQLIGARSCAFENCKFQHLGWYGVELAEGCSGNRIVGNDMSDLGGGGVKINGSGSDKPNELTRGNRITDNHIHHGGRIFPSACGIISMTSANNTLSHNEIDDFYYTGISVGWVWGYSESPSHDNLIEKNHVHNIGQGLLGDMAAIYTLGNQTGTIIRGNLLHDLTFDCHAIYPDEGSSYLTVENNICYDFAAVGYFQHYGRENIVRNNIFALGNGTGLVTLCKGADRNSFTFERNILLTKSQPIYRAHYAIRWQDPPQLKSDLNLIWDLDIPAPHSPASTSNSPLANAAVPNLIMAQNYKDDTRQFKLDEWRSLGYDLHSLIANPQFKDPAHGDFTLSPSSPAFSLGFQPIDLSDVGPRPPEKRD